MYCTLVPAVREGNEPSLHLTEWTRLVDVCLGPVRAPAVTDAQDGQPSQPNLGKLARPVSTCI